jgi:hypothetical protein
MTTAYNWQDGWRFRRYADEISIQKVRTDGTTEEAALIPVAEFASILAHLADGGSAQAFRLATDLLSATALSQVPA